VQHPAAIPGKGRMFMDQYTKRWNAFDLIAERIRAPAFPPVDAANDQPTADR